MKIVKKLKIKSTTQQDPSTLTAVLSIGHVACSFSHFEMHLLFLISAHVEWHSGIGHRALGEGGGSPNKRIKSVGGPQKKRGIPRKKAQFTFIIKN